MVIPMSKSLFATPAGWIKRLWRIPPKAVVALACWLGCANGWAEQLSFDFSKTPAGRQPDGFTSLLVGQGSPGEWKIVEAEVPSAFEPLTPNATRRRGSVLAQVDRDPTDERFPVLVYEGLEVADFTFKTKFKTVEGLLEQMAGIVFRFKDTNNFYYVRASSKGNTFRFFKVVNGQRANPIGPEVAIPSGVWHEMSVECKGNQIKCFLNGEQVIPTLTDNSHAFGKVGFWTKSDSVSHFVSAVLHYTPREGLAGRLIKQALKENKNLLAVRIYAPSRGDLSKMEVIASSDPSQVGMAGTELERSVVEKGQTYGGKTDSGDMLATVPLHDRNGEPVAALRVELKGFFGQNEAAAVRRALPIARVLDRQILEAGDLY